MDPPLPEPHQRIESHRREGDQASELWRLAPSQLLNIPPGGGDERGEVLQPEENTLPPQAGVPELSVEGSRDRSWKKNWTSVPHPGP